MQLFVLEAYVWPEKRALFVTSRRMPPQAEMMQKGSPAASYMSNVQNLSLSRAGLWETKR
jgi:hypothetical protein